jgi:DNA-binding LacI/PurR family transcriptional regulator
MTAKKASASHDITSIKQLAEHLNLSWWTVSRALNGHPEVKKATRDRIFEAVRESGFLPNPLARGLVGGRTGMIGVSFHELENPGLMKTIGALQRKLRDRQYKILMELGCDDLQLEADAVAHFAAMRVDGVVLFSSRQKKNGPALSVLQNKRIPFVMVDSEHPITPRVRVERRQAIADVVSHLYDLNHRHFCLAGIDPDIWYNKERWTAFAEALSERKLKVEDQLLLPGTRPPMHDYAAGERLADQYLALNKRPTAIITISDRVATGFVRQLQKAGVQVPEECSVVGAQNLDVAAYAVPSLTTVDYRTEEEVETAIDLLFRQIEGKTLSSREKSRSVRPKIIQRESTGPAPVRR